MSPLHLTDEALDALVSGTGPPAPPDEAHLAECATCAERLALHAQADELLRAVRRPIRTRSSVPRFALAASLAALLAGGGLLGVRAHAPAPAATVVDLGEVICPDGDDQDPCIEAAHAHGLVVAYPVRAGGPDVAALAEPFGALP